jgi:hypothetical protein
MTYYDIIQEFFLAAQGHWMIEDVGYGPISDIKSRSQTSKGIIGLEGEINNPDYPYMFLNPGTHTRTGSTVTYTFNLIMMDLAWEEVPNPDDDNVNNPSVTRYTNEAQVQSNCQRLIDDIISQLYYGSPKIKAEISFDVTYTPFVERFQDSVAGMTANIKIQVPQPIDNCVAPFIGE